MFIAQRRARAAENRRIYRISIVSQGNGTDQFLQRFADMRLPPVYGAHMAHLVARRSLGKALHSLKAEAKKWFPAFPAFPRHGIHIHVHAAGAVGTAGNPRAEAACNG